VQKRRGIPQATRADVQIGCLQMIAGIDFASINSAALRNGRSLVQDLIPGGKFRSLEYVVKNPCRNDERPGSFTINYRDGVWKDFATDDGGSDFISLVAYLKGLSQGEAARELATKYGVSLVKSNGFASEGKANGNNGVTHKSSSPSNAPKIFQWGDEGPPKKADEVRRHIYRSSDCPLRIKIKLTDGKYVQWYRVVEANGAPVGGKIGNRPTIGPSRTSRRASTLSTRSWSPTKSFGLRVRKISTASTILICLPSPSVGLVTVFPTTLLGI
jgi:hypothetical protein